MKNILLVISSLILLKLIFKAFSFIELSFHKRLIDCRLTCGLVSKNFLSSISTRQFEEWCSSLLKEMGYENVAVSHGGPDEEKDIICCRDKHTVYVECKKYSLKSKPLNSDDFMEVEKSDVQILIGDMIHDKIYRGIIMTTGYFTLDAREYVKTLPPCYCLELMDGDRLTAEHGKLREKTLTVPNMD